MMISQFNRPLAIGKLRLRNNLIMAPMAGITDVPFRALVKEGGAGLVCTEMVSAKALEHHDEKTKRIITITGEEHPVSAQIFGSEPKLMAQAAKMAEDRGADVVDINFGCPAPKIMRSGAGAKLAANTELMAEIMASVVRSVSVPVTVKIRIGRTPDENNAPEIVSLAEKAGVKMVVVHGRPASSMHRGEPDLEAIARAVRAATSIPVVGNGGITDEISAREFLAATGCAGLMIGRAAIGDPGIFIRIETFLRTGEMPRRPPWEDRISCLRKHAALSVDFYGQRTGILRLRKVAPYYLRGLPNSARIRDKFNRLSSFNELERLVEEIWQSPYFFEAASGD